MAEIKLQEPVIELKDLPARAKSLDEDGQSNVFGGFFNVRALMARRRAAARSFAKRLKSRFGRARKATRRVPVYAWRRVRVLVGYRRG